MYSPNANCAQTTVYAVSLRTVDLVRGMKEQSRRFTRASPNSVRLGVGALHHKASPGMRLRRSGPAKGRNRFTRSAARVL